MRRIITLILFVSLFAALFASAPSVKASGYYLNYSNFGGTCSATGFSISATATYTLPTAVTVTGNTTLNGSPYDTYSFGIAAGSGSFNTGFGRFFSPALSSANYTFVFNSVVSAGGTTYGTAIITITCSGGTLSVTGVWSLGGYAGPPIPAGFVLRVITCDIAVFDSAGGSPVGANKITAGQTWFVNPKPVKDASGKSWTEIFVSGIPNGFIWTSCVAGRPAGYSGD